MSRDRPQRQPSAEAWRQARGLSPAALGDDARLHCALLPDAQNDNDHIAVLYNTGETPPEITIEEVSGTVHTVRADGVAVAVIASVSAAAAPRADRVLLVERVV